MATLTGTVNPFFKPLAYIIVRGVAGAEQTVEAMIDTGFNGNISLPLTVITALGLSKIGECPVKLTNGVVEITPIYKVRVMWEGFERPITAIGSGDEPLIGMGFLNGYPLTIEITPDGDLTVEPLT